MIRYVLDASAVLALLFVEAGAEEVAAALGEATLAAPNASEVVTVMIRQGLAASEARRKFLELQVAIEPMDAELALRAGELWHDTRDFGLSLGDRACLALAEKMRVPALTADRMWRGLPLQVDVRLIRR